MNKITAIIQARVGATRLPGKVLFDLEGKTVLERVIERVKVSKLINEIIVATTIKDEDLAIVKVCSDLGVRSFCGSEADVLDRYYQVAKLCGAVNIVRITADCPLIDPDVIDEILSHHLEKKADYTSNTIKVTYPDGEDVEVFTFKALQKTWKSASLTSEREHVTPYMRKNNSIFKVESLERKDDLSSHRWTLDCSEDYEFIKTVYKNLYPQNHLFKMNEILDFLAKNSDVTIINRNIIRNEGYLKSLRNDAAVCFNKFSAGKQDIKSLDNNSFKVNDISPGYLNAEQAKLFSADIRRLQRYKKKFVWVPCPACGANNTKKFFKKFQLDYVICNQCATMYINPRPTPQILEIYYKKSENYRYWNKYIFPASENVRREKIFRPRVEKIIDLCKRYEVSRNTLLEVGAGFGIFCEEIKKTGFFKRVIGIEPTPDLAQTCRRNGLEIIEKPIEQVFFENMTLNVIASFEVIEHIFCPRDFLKKCNSMLAPGGLIVLTCPNGKGFDISVLGSISDAVDVEHLNYFNLDSLSQLLNQCGFMVLEATTPGKLDAERVRNAVLNKEFNLDTFSFLKQVLIDKWDTIGDSFQQFLADNRLSSHMLIIGRKR